MNNPFEYTPDAVCEKAFRKLIADLEALKKSNRPEDVAFISELEEGKMLGVLIATDSSGDSHTLYAFSGQLGHSGFHYPGFVGPVFDYLQPGGYFKTKEMEISIRNNDIYRFEKNELAAIRDEYERAKERVDSEISEYKEKCRLSKIARNARRISGLADKDELAALLRQSQFEKAELHRLKKRCYGRLEPFATKLAEAESLLISMKDKRRSDSASLQKWLFTNFRLLNARGESKSLSEIFAECPMGVPPSGAGECCAPKLLHAAYIQGWHPEAIAEYWYGNPKEGEVRIHGRHYPACRGKCLPVLGWMLEGLTIEPPLNTDSHTDAIPDPKIIYENKWFCIVDKPAGMISVPGKTGKISVQQWLTERYGADREVRLGHRLDQDTSGLLIATFGLQSYKVIQSLFATRNVKKTYVADLEGNYESLGIPRKGHIELPLSPDRYDRPRQRIDIVAGKEAATYYEFTGKPDERSRIMFRPLTGRTHQLRVHAAAADGLGMPIVGDRLYGRNAADRTERLHLHAHKLEFTFPLDGCLYRFESPVPF